MANTTSAARSAVNAPVTPWVLEEAVKPHPFRPFMSYVITDPETPIYSDWCAYFDKPLAVLAILTEEEVNAAHCGKSKNDSVHEESGT
jgi:hypothetical protein